LIDGFFTCVLNLNKRYKYQSESEVINKGKININCFRANGLKMMLRHV